MKYLLKLKAYTFCFLISFLPTLSVANIMDCPAEKEKLCAEIKKLEEIYLQLPEQSGFQKKDLSGPAYALSLGYANIGNIDKAEEYLDQSYKADPSRRKYKYNRSAIFEQYMLRGQYDDVFSYLEEGNTHRSLCKSTVQILTFQKRVDLIEKLLTDTECSPKSLSYGADPLDRDDIVNIYKKLNLLSGNHIAENHSHFSIQSLFGGSLKQKTFEREINGLLALIVAKSFDNDPLPPIFDFIEKQALEDIPHSKALIRKLISFYAARNDLKALELFRESKPQLERSKDALPAYNLRQDPTELSFLIYNDVENIDHRVKLLESLLRSVSSKSDLAQNKEFKHISERCLKMNFSQCIAAHIPKEKINEKLGLKIDAYTSNYEQLREFEINSKARIKELEKTKGLSISKNSSGNYTAEETHYQDPLWDVHVFIANKDDCDHYYDKDIEKIQNNIQNFTEYTGNNPYYAVLCLFTKRQHEELLVKSNTKEYEWLVDFFAAAFQKTTSTSVEHLLKNTDYLKANINQKIKKAIITALLRVVDDEGLKDSQREKIYDAIDGYLVKKENYDPQLLNIVFSEYFYDRQNERANNLISGIPEFQKYIEKNYESDNVSKIIRSGYKIPLNENALINKSKTLSWVVMNTVRKDNEFNPR